MYGYGSMAAVSNIPVSLGTDEWPALPPETILSLRRLFQSGRAEFWAALLRCLGGERDGSLEGR